LGYSSKGTISGDGNYLGAIVDIPKDVPFVSEFLVGEAYGLGAIIPQKKTNFSERCRRLL